jgi:hypothetical protein
MQRGTLVWLEFHAVTGYSEVFRGSLLALQAIPEYTSGHGRFLPLPFLFINHCLTIRCEGVPGGNFNIRGGHSIGHSKQEGVYIHVSYSERFPR